MSSGESANAAQGFKELNNGSKGEEAQNEIKEKSGNDAIDLMLADLSSQESIRQLAENFLQRYTKLHVLINNAGMSSLRRRETVDGLEVTFAVNQLAPFLLTNVLLDVIKASAPSRIINASSEAAAAIVGGERQAGKIAYEGVSAAC